MAIETPLVVTVALALGVLATALLVRALHARRRRRRRSVAHAPQAALPCAAAGDGR
ncbi:MAG TPA: hypothetical protein VE997_01700 [Candidatus Limnocylindria bacterium]|nr:hypothetical protein [Candidatus Limnocylindria bacterium]